MICVRRVTTCPEAVPAVDIEASTPDQHNYRVVREFDEQAVTSLS